MHSTAKLVNFVDTEKFSFVFFRILLFQACQSEDEKKTTCRNHKDNVLTLQFQRVEIADATCCLFYSFFKVLCLVCNL